MCINIYIIYINISYHAYDMIYYAFCSLLHGKVGTSWTGCKNVSVCESWCLRAVSRLVLCRSTWCCGSLFTPLIPKQRQQRQAKHLVNRFQLPCSTFTNNVLKIREWTLETLDLILKGCQQHFLSICPTEKPGARDKNGQKDTKKVQRDSRNPHLCLVCLVCDLLGVRQAKLSLKKLQPATLCDRWSQGKVLEALFSGSKGK